MNLRSLRYLTALADTRHFGRAAERCFVSQPTLSTQIMKLEERLGVQLVERRHRNVMLTPIGEEVVERARRVVGEADQILELARSQQDPLSGRVRIGFIPTLGPYLLPHIVPQLHDALPRLELLLYERRTDDLLGALAAGDLDAAVLALPVADAGLSSRALFDEAFYAALPAGHPLAERKRISVDDLEGERMLLLDDGHCLRDQALDVCGNAGVEEIAGFRATSLETLRQMVAAGVGMTLLPALAARPLADVDLLVTRPFCKPVPGRSIGAVWRRTAPRSTAIDAVCDVIEKRMRGLLRAGEPRERPA